MASDAISFPLLQFDDDIILICEASWENLWSVKTILRSFELASGLRVNFSKSNIFGTNLQDNFLSAASHFLSCCTRRIPFKFLGLPVGANPRRCSTWEPIVDSLKKRLAVWKGRYLSIGGRIALINSVLSSLPLYFSFFKAPKKVLKSLVAIQRNFLWNGCGESQKINWVCWEKVCLLKDKRGLGVKNLEWFNHSLLAKWKWRCLNDEEAVWHDLLAFKYGSFKDYFLGNSPCSINASWW